jgi:hypothetical protein
MGAGTAGAAGNGVAFNSRRGRAPLPFDTKSLMAGLHLSPDHARKNA